MQTVSAHPTKRIARTPVLPGYIWHRSFAEKAAWRGYDPDSVAADEEFNGGYMPNEVSVDRAKRMHYAAHRVRTARTTAGRGRWTAAYIALRDAIVLGNRKLVYRAVRRRMAMSNYAEDMVGDCQIVLIQAVAAFDPWLGIRFSTYAYTCLIRAISRTSQKLSNDVFSRMVSVESSMLGEPSDKAQPEQGSSNGIPIEQFLRAEHPLLSPREKTIISLRFCLSDVSANQSLEQVGRSVGLSKERVRQVQASALGKLRRALTDPAMCEDADS